MGKAHEILRRECVHLRLLQAEEAAHPKRETDEGSWQENNQRGIAGKRRGYDDGRTLIRSDQHP
jgi:hypothetical protein